MLHKAYMGFFDEVDVKENSLKLESVTNGQKDKRILKDYNMTRKIQQ